MKKLGQKAVQNRLKRYYDHKYKVTGEMTDEWCIDPAPNMWRFQRGSKTITLICDVETGHIEEVVK